MANLRLKKLILEVVDNQLRENNPPVTKESYDKLIDAGYSAREAKEKIGAIVIEQIYDVIKETKENTIINRKNIQKSLCFSPLDDSLLEPILRLVKLTTKEENITFLSNLVLKEIIYILLQQNGDFLKQHVLEGNLTNQIVKAITEIKNNYSDTINIHNRFTTASMAALSSPSPMTISTS